MKILVTGGLGYIGSHTIVKLIEKNYDVICLDNLINSDFKIKKKIEKITKKKFKFHKIDLTNINDLKKILKKYKKIDYIIHFASLIYVPESLEKPFKYYSNNLISLLNIIEISKKYKSGLIFSSSSTVYGASKKFPITEDMPLGILYFNEIFSSEVIFEEPITLNTLEIILLDENGFKYDFSNLHYTLSFKLDVLINLPTEIVQVV